MDISITCHVIIFGIVFYVVVVYTELRAAFLGLVMIYLSIGGFLPIWS